MNRVWFAAAGRPDPDDLVRDRALRFGMSVFETIAVFCGRPLFLADHLERLERASQDLLASGAPASCRLARQIFSSGDLEGQTGTLRIYVTAGPGSVDDPPGPTGGHAHFEAGPVVCGPGSGLNLAVDRAPYCAPPGGWKTGNYWQNVRARSFARAGGCDEALLLAPTGEVVGCATGTLFVVIDGYLLTPRREAGARDGTVRAWVMNRAGATEEMLDLGSLSRASECFMTNSRRGVAAISRVEETPFAVGHMAVRLAGIYSDEILRA